MTPESGEGGERAHVVPLPASRDEDAAAQETGWDSIHSRRGGAGWPLSQGVCALGVELVPVGRWVVRWHMGGSVLRMGTHFHEQSEIPHR